MCATPSKADVLETAHGDEVRALARVHTTARRLKGALEERRPPLQYTDGVLKQWLHKCPDRNCFFLLVSRIVPRHRLRLKVT